MTAQLNFNLDDQEDYLKYNRCNKSLDLALCLFNLKERMYKAQYNHNETKYISLDIMFKLTEMMYEISYTFRMILDNNSEFKKITLDVPKISTTPLDLYTLIIFLCTLFCKKYSFTGEIPMKPESVAYIYGFNFRSDIVKIREDILSDNNKYIDIMNEILNYLNSKTKRSYKLTNKHKSILLARIKENYTPADFREVVDIKCEQWLTDPVMTKYLRPETLFSNKFDSYLNEKNNTLIPEIKPPINITGKLPDGTYEPI